VPTWARRRWAILFLLLPALAGARESFEEAEGRWLDYLDGLGPLSREERMEKARQFFLTVEWENLHYYCTDSHAQAGPSASSALGSMVDARLRAGDWDPAVIAAMLSDPGCNAHCQRAILQQFRTRVDSLRSLPEAAIYSEALLALADSGARQAGVGRQIERAAAALDATPSLMDRMMGYARADDSVLRVHGTAMLRESCDPAARDSLRVVADELLAQGGWERPLGQALIGLSEGEDARRHFDFFEGVAAVAEGEVGRGLYHETLCAMARSGDPRAYPHILAAYGDSLTGIADKTSALPQGKLRQRYWNLWHMTRLCERGMIEVFEENAPGASEALELLDRASRFGLPALREEILAPLQAWGARQDAATAARAAEVLERFRAWPDPLQSPKR